MPDLSANRLRDTMDQHAVGPTFVSTFVYLVASICCNIGCVNEQFFLTDYRLNEYQNVFASAGFRFTAIYVGDSRCANKRR